MRILYIGDVMGDMGLDIVEQLLPDIKRSEQVDVVIAQAENVTAGKGLSQVDYERLRGVGVDGFSGGNHTPSSRETLNMLSNPELPVVGPANMPECAEPGYKYIESPAGRVLMVSLLGKIVGRDADNPVKNPIQTIDAILESQKGVDRVATVVNIHGDYSSEKVVMGYYLDGKVSVVVGDHWHVPTADVQVLPGGTAHQTDVGMCGSLDSSLGVEFASVIPRWRDGKQTRNVLATTGRKQFNALLVEVDDSTGLATQARTIRKIIEA